MKALEHLHVGASVTGKFLLESNPVAKSSMTYVSELKPRTLP